MIVLAGVWHEDYTRAGQSHKVVRLWQGLLSYVCKEGRFSFGLVQQWERHVVWNNSYLGW